MHENKAPKDALICIRVVQSLNLKSTCLLKHPSFVYSETMKTSFPAGDSNTGLSLPDSVTATSSDGSQGAAAASEGHPQQMPYTDDPYPDIGPLQPALSELVQAQTFSSSAYDSFCLED